MTSKVQSSTLDCREVNAGRLRIAYRLHREHVKKGFDLVTQQLAGIHGGTCGHLAHVDSPQLHHFHLHSACSVVIACETCAKRALSKTNSVCCKWPHECAARRRRSQVCTNTPCWELPTRRRAAVTIGHGQFRRAHDVTPLIQAGLAPVRFVQKESQPITLAGLQTRPTGPTDAPALRCSAL